MALVPNNPNATRPCVEEEPFKQISKRFFHYMITDPVFKPPPLHAMLSHYNQHVLQ